MKKNFSFTTNLFFFLIIYSSSFAQFQFDAQLRNRLEMRNGYKQLIADNQQTSAFISQRTRLSFLFENEKLKLKISPQDVRVWGDEQLGSSSGVLGDNASVDVHEAYAELKLNAKTSLSIGRQELAYDNEWLLAARNWNQNGLTYDAALLKFATNSVSVHLAASWNSSAETVQDNFYASDRIKSLNFLWIDKKVNENLQLSMSYLATGVTKTLTSNAIRFKHTSGLFANYKSKTLNFRTNIYYQLGKNIADNTVNAFLLDGELSYIFGGFSAGIGTSYLSGDDNVNDNTEKLFDMFYGARHKYFGHMDYFGNIPKTTKQGGLIDFNAFIKFKTSDKTSITNYSHYFKLAQSNTSSPNDKNLGFENELSLQYKLSNWVNIQTSYLFFLPTESMKTIQAVSDAKMQQFFFLQLTINPTLFSNLKQE